MEETAPAKVNLALHVRARAPDGYHRLETIFAFAEAGDIVRVAPSETLTLAVEGPFARHLCAGEDNLVLRAARALARRYRIAAGAALTLDKRLPVASGIGGGSADAAATLRLLNRWWGIDAPEAELLEVARPLGADVPACLLSRTARGEGRGDLLVELDAPDLAGAPLLLVNPGLPVPTARVFAAWPGDDRGPLPDRWENGRNDLQAPAIALVPEIADALALLGAAGGARRARMSGSGATCFAIFGSEAARDHAAAETARARPGWWQLASRLR
jgi:4-diphosphocytidyl-2-C-methyl-D-erythritol kinase